MGNGVSLCFSKSQKVDSVKIENTQKVVDVPAQISPSSSSSSYRVTPTSSSIPKQNNRNLVDKTERSFISINSVARQSSDSNLEPQKVSGISPEFKKDGVESAIRRPANPTPRGSCTLRDDAVLSGNVEVQANVKLPAFKSKSEVHLENKVTNVAQREVFLQNFNQPKIRSEFTETDNKTSIVGVLSYPKILPLKSSLSHYSKELQTFGIKRASPTELGGCLVGQSERSGDCLPNETKNVLPRLSPRARRPKHGMTSTRVPVFTDPLITGDSDSQYEELLVETTAWKPSPALGSIPEPDRCRKLRPLHGKSSNRMPIFTDPLMTRDSNEDCESEILDKTTESQPDQLGNGGDFITGNSQMTSGRVMLTPMDKGKKLKTLEGQSPRLVPALTHPMIIGKNKPVRLKKIPESLNKKVMSESWQHELDKVLLCDGGNNDSLLPNENNSDEIILNGTKQPSKRMVLDDFATGNDVELEGSCRPKHLALKNPLVSSSQHGSSKGSFPFVDTSASSIPTATRETSNERLESLHRIIDELTVEEKRKKKFSTVRLDPICNNTRSSTCEPIANHGGKQWHQDVNDFSVNRRPKSRLSQGFQGDLDGKANRSTKGWDID